MITDLGNRRNMKTRFAVTSHYLKQVVFRGDFQVLTIDRTWVGSLERVKHEIRLSGLTCCTEEESRGSFIQWGFVCRAVTWATELGASPVKSGRPVV